MPRRRKVRPSEVTGYIVGLETNPASGMALVQVSDRPGMKLRPWEGRVTQHPIEAGAGLREIARFFGGAGNLPLHAPHTRLRFTLDQHGVISAFGPADAN